MVQKVIPLSALDDRIRALDAQIATLNMERGMLNTLRGSAVELETGETVSERTPPLTERVVSFVVRNQGRTSAEITDAMLANFARNGETLGGSDPRKTLLTTIGSLVSKGRLHKDAEGGHFVR